MNHCTNVNIHCTCKYTCTIRIKMIDELLYTCQYPCACTIKNKKNDYLITSQMSTKCG